MKSFSLIAVILCIALAGCATQRHSQPDPRIAEMQAYVDSNKPLAREGKIKWSEYYGGVRDRYIALGAPYEIVHLVSQIMYGAQEFEAGNITKDEFVRRQGYANTQMQDISLRERQAADAQQQANRALAMHMLMSRPMTPAPLQFTPMVPASGQMALQSPSTTATAFWTGKQQQVQTVTYQSGWNCEYNYAGRTFWRTFVGSCPSSVQVQ